MRPTPEDKETVRRRLAQQLESYFKDDGEWKWPHQNLNRYSIICEIMDQLGDLKKVNAMDEDYWDCQPLPGSDISKVCAAAWSLAVISKIPVNFKFNSIFISMRDYSTIVQKRTED